MSRTRSLQPGVAGRRPARRQGSIRRANAERLECRTLLAVFTVTTTADEGPGSLRQAILDANAAPTDDTIAFALPGPSHRIAPGSPLPAVSGATVIDGATQPDFFVAPVVELSGANAGDGADGLVLRGPTTCAPWSSTASAATASSPPRPAAESRVATSAPTPPATRTPATAASAWS